MLNEFAFIPSGAANPFAWFERGGFLTDESDDVLNASDLTKCDVIEDGRLVKMTMRVDEAGGDRKTVEIDDLGGFWSNLSNLLVGADRHDFTIVNGDSL